MLPELPQGNGLAANYPGDVGIEQHPAVVFADGFEDLNDVVLDGSAYPQAGNRWDNAWGLVRVTRDPENVHGGRQAIEITHTHPRSHGAEKRLDPGHDTLFLRYYMKYAREFPGCHHTGMAIQGSVPGTTIGCTTGVRPDGRNHFTALIDIMPPWTGASPEPPGFMDVYCYHMDQRRKWGDILYPTGETYPPETQGLFGEDFVPRPRLMAERGRWYCYELMVQANTPGQRDGRVAFWVDGVLAGDFPNLRLRSVDLLKANYVVIISYSSSQHANVTHWYDDIVAATSYIGLQV
ncbi:MAG: hypothetical protein FJ315_06330 [SAR202 cluster bacterium]|nr:hypothetical protein [SAR202 cluster bacterium]